MELKLTSLSNKSFKFIWGDSSQPTLTEIEVPDLTKLNHSVWGDWGPMYTFSLKESQPIKLRHNQESFESPQKTLSIISPMEFRERDQYPFFMTIEDVHRDLNFYIYLDKDYELGKIQVFDKMNNSKLFENDLG